MVQDLPGWKNPRPPKNNKRNQTMSIEDPSVRLNGQITTLSEVKKLADVKFGETKSSFRTSLNNKNVIDYRTIAASFHEHNAYCVLEIIEADDDAAGQFLASLLNQTIDFELTEFNFKGEPVANYRQNMTLLSFVPVDYDVAGFGLKPMKYHVVLKKE